MSMSSPPTPPNAKPEVLATETLYKGHIFSVARQRIRLAGGAEIEREFVDHPGAAAVLPFVDAQTVLLVQQYRPAAQDTLIEVPAGVIDPGEAPETSAQRELAEETGYRAGKLLHLLSCYPTPGFVRETLALYVAWELSEVAGGANTDADEHLELVRMPFAQLRDAVKRGEIRDGKTVALVSHLCAFPPQPWQAWRDGAAV